jgi:translation elongation factor EF-Ts
MKGTGIFSIHDPKTCKICKVKEEKTLSELDHVMEDSKDNHIEHIMKKRDKTISEFQRIIHGEGLFSDFEKLKKEKKIANN